MTAQLTPTPAEVLDAAARQIGNFRYPLTPDAVIWALAPATAPVADAKNFVHAPTVDNALAALTKDGRMIARTGREWKAEYGIAIKGDLYATTYYAPTAVAERWAQEHAARTQAAADALSLAQAHAYALERLGQERPDLLARYIVEFNARNGA